MAKMVLRAEKDKDYKAVIAQSLEQCLTTLFVLSSGKVKFASKLRNEYVRAFLHVCLHVLTPVHLLECTKGRAKAKIWDKKDRAPQKNTT